MCVCVCVHRGRRHASASPRAAGRAPLSGGPPRSAGVSAGVGGGPTRLDSLPNPKPSEGRSVFTFCMGKVRLRLSSNSSNLGCSWWFLGTWRFEQVDFHRCAHNLPHKSCTKQVLKVWSLLPWSPDPQQEQSSKFLPVPLCQSNFKDWCLFIAI